MRSIMWGAGIFGALILMLFQNLPVDCELETPHKVGKIAFLFLVRGHMPLEDVWREFFGWKADPSYYNIYVHTHEHFKYHNTSFFHGKEIQSHNVKWGGMSQVRAIKSLVREALRDPLNEWFCLMSESCIPLHPFPVWLHAFQGQKKSMVNACPFSQEEMETESRWRPALDKVGMVKSQWRKSATWFMLNRAHSMIFANETALEIGWEDVPCCDEHYLPSLLAYHGLDNETTCTDGFSHVQWDSKTASHPHSYINEEIGEALFSKFERPVGLSAGFSEQCSGNDKICHFTARKFSSANKLRLIENIHYILGDSVTNLTYSNDRWHHVNQKLRIIDASFYLIEEGILKLIPDAQTLRVMHLNATYATQLNDHDKKAFPVGTSYLSRRDGIVYKTNRNNAVYLMMEGYRRCFPNMDTMITMGYSMANVTFVPEAGLEFIPVGPLLPTK